MDNFRIPQLPTLPTVKKVGQLLVIYDPDTDVTYKIPIQFLGFHTQNTDTHTTGAIFGIQHPSQNQDPDGNTVLVFGGAQGYPSAAIRYKWSQDNNVPNLFQRTLNYTGGVNDVWENFGEGEQGIPGEPGEPGEPGKDAYQAWLDLGNVGTKAQYLAWMNAEVSKVIPLKITFGFQEITLLAEAWLVFDSIINITGVTSTDQIASATYEVKADGGVYIPKATFALVNDWISANMVSGNKYWIKVIATPVANAAGPAQHTVTYNELG